MKAHITTLASLLLLPLSTSLAAAETALPQPVEGMECLVGTWKGSGTLTLGKDTAKVDATWLCKRTSARWGVTCTMTLAGVPGAATYEETDLMGYDPSTNLFHWYAVTSAGDTHDHVAKAPADPKATKLQFRYTGKQDGKPLKEVIDFEFSPDGKQVSGHGVTTLAGATASVLDLKLAK